MVSDLFNCIDQFSPPNQQPGATLHINDENGESYIRVGPATETESGSGSDLHVIREESFTGKHSKIIKFN